MFRVAEFGTDFNSNYTFSNGDIDLISDKQNLVQAIINRLRTPEDTYDLSYNKYGGRLEDFHGWKKTQTTLDFIKNEIGTILSQDPRCNNYDLTLEYVTTGIHVKINLVFDDDSDLSLSLVISDGGIVSEDEED